MLILHYANRRVEQEPQWKVQFLLSEYYRLELSVNYSPESGQPVQSEILITLSG